MEVVGIQGAGWTLPGGPQSTPTGLWVIDPKTGKWIKQKPPVIDVPHQTDHIPTGKKIPAGQKLEKPTAEEAIVEEETPTPEDTTGRTPPDRYTVIKKARPTSRSSELQAVFFTAAGLALGIYVYKRTTSVGWSLATIILTPAALTLAANLVSPPE